MVIPPQSSLSFPLGQALVRLKKILQLHCLFYRVIIFWFRQEDWFQVVEASLSALVNDIPLQDSSSCAKSSPCPGQIASPPPSVRKTSLVSFASNSGDPDVLFLFRVWSLVSARRTTKRARARQAWPYHAHDSCLFSASGALPQQFCHVVFVSFTTLHVSLSVATLLTSKHGHHMSHLICGNTLSHRTIRSEKAGVLRAVCGLVQTLVSIRKTEKEKKGEEGERKREGEEGRRAEKQRSREAEKQGGSAAPHIGAYQERLRLRPWITTQPRLEHMKSHRHPQTPTPF